MRYVGHDLKVKVTSDNNLCRERLSLNWQDEMALMQPMVISALSMLIVANDGLILYHKSYES